MATEFERNDQSGQKEMPDPKETSSGSASEDVAFGELNICLACQFYDLSLDPLKLKFLKAITPENIFTRCKVWQSRLLLPLSASAKEIAAKTPKISIVKYGLVGEKVEEECNTHRLRPVS